VKKYLVIGDFHIPRRARDLPTRLYDVAGRGGFDAVLCTGDLVGRGVLDTMEALAPQVHAVAGNMDVLDLPESVILEAEGWRIGLVHGAGIVPRGDPERLGRLALRLDVDLLLHGHTHADDAYRRRVEGREILFVNPGSATGIPGGTGGSLRPSLAVVAVAPREVVVERFRLSSGSLVEVRDVFPRG
jgi:putative phosphoesterase